MEFKEIATVAQTVVFPLIAVVWFFMRKEIDDLKQKIHELAENKDYFEKKLEGNRMHFDKRFEEMKDFLTALRIQLITDHPTKKDISQWLPTSHIKMDTSSS